MLRGLALHSVATAGRLFDGCNNPVRNAFSYFTDEGIETQGVIYLPKASICRRRFWTPVFLSPKTDFFPLCCNFALVNLRGINTKLWTLILKSKCMRTPLGAKFYLKHLWERLKKAFSKYRLKITQTRIINEGNC